MPYMFDFFEWMEVVLVEQIVLCEGVIKEKSWHNLAGTTDVLIMCTDFGVI